MIKNIKRPNTVKTSMPSRRVNAEAARKKAILAKNNIHMVGSSILNLLETNLLSVTL